MMRLHLGTERHARLVRRALKCGTVHTERRQRALAALADQTLSPDLAAEIVREALLDRRAALAAAKVRWVVIAVWPTHQRAIAIVRARTAEYARVRARQWAFLAPGARLIVRAAGTASAWELLGVARA